jgi:sulfatase modifying factor 1
MTKFFSNFNKKSFKIVIFLLGIFFVLLFNWVSDYTSTNDFCSYCHVHPQATNSWRLGNHYDNKNGIVVHCVECHLPPGGIDYLQAKISTGLRDVYGALFEDVSKINWELKSTRPQAEKHVYKASCIHCHANLFPRTLSKKGEDAHIYYDQKADQLRCINCHLEVGHFHEKSAEPTGIDLAKKRTGIKYVKPALVDSFKNFREMIPGTKVDFDMVTIPGGTFKIGSPESEPYRSEDEGPQRSIQISSFWMGKYEVTWDEYEAFYQDTKREGRTEDQYRYVNNSKDIDAYTGPTPAYGNPDQGWGKGTRPAITMTHHAAEAYCAWLSQKTGKNYRLPTEAEWEYACRGQTKSAYFFPGSPEQFSPNRLWNKIFGTDTTFINSHMVYAANSNGKTEVPTRVKMNPFGLVNMLGNVKEFCSDWYGKDAYRYYPEDPPIIDPKGPSEGKEYVIRGGSYLSDAGDVRVAERNYTRNDQWLLTDPQMPKSIWWYSDCSDVGFRVVCDYTKN